MRNIFSLLRLFFLNTAAYLLQTFLYILNSTGKKSNYGSAQGNCCNFGGGMWLKIFFHYYICKKGDFPFFKEVSGNSLNMRFFELDS